MTDPVDQEIEAIRQVLSALQPLSETARASVLEYVAKRLSIPSGVATPHGGEIPPIPPHDIPEREGHQGVIHIRDFKDQKKPRSANEMAALVAYYLENHSSPEARKNTVNQKDIETYFKIAQFPLPKTIRVTLTNARNAGYFDLVGEGEYKLNAVGHNLVVHSMPRGTAVSKTGSRPKARKPTRTQPAAKKSSRKRSSGKSPSKSG